ncbi:hypothetical protein VTN77DRAFT_4070 [Rasamsonia byssochlamydoides]|uniref:uncharacterized protein n=1 Tax=Rasamsonia byssochlamydoides TaxID=89139 RepID=UPI0037421934
MASRDPAATVRPRSRRSIAHMPRSKTTSGVDQENVTTDIGTIRGGTSNGKSGSRDKKSRSKSIGPGGLDALQDSNGNRRKSTAAFPLKSILKPTIPVSPIQQIPSFAESRKRASSRSPSPSKSRNGTNRNQQPGEGLLIDFSTPTRAPVSGTDQLDNPFDAFNASSAIRDAKEREERERRERERQAIIEQREARRKSMANRRVSFAPEATLHTWNVVELGEDSTSSSASNSTRRASSLTNSTNQAGHGSDHSDPPSSPEPDDDPDAAFSPVPHHGLHGQSEDLSSSPFSGSSAGGSEEPGTPGGDGGDGEGESDSDNDFDGESTAMSLDDVTSRTNATSHSDGSTTSSSERLNAALRQAAQAAGTQAIGVDEDGEMSMEIADQEITGAFQPWIKKGQRISFDMEDLSALQDQENINPFQPQGQSNNDDDDDNDIENEELSMDITNALGRILGKDSSRRQSTDRRKSTGEETNYDEKTMEFTNVVGGIQAQQSPAKSDADSNVSENEEMTMEFTSVVGGVLSKRPLGSYNPDGSVFNDTPQQQTSAGRNFSEWGTDEDDGEEMDMEFTGAVGGILSPIEERTEPQDDQTAGMDFTTAMGRILSPEVGTDNKQQAKELMELESDAGQLVSSPFQEQVPPSPPKLPASHHVAPVASESGSPSLASVKSRQTRRSSERRPSTTPTSPSRQTTPLRKPSTPSKQLTPQPLQPSTPGKTPPSSNMTFRSASPSKKLFRQEIASATKSQSPRRGNLFESDAKTGQSTPAFILRPHPRRSSGLGIDKEGLGSPRVAEMLDRRRSIGEDAQEFVPQAQPPRQLRFDDPVKMQEEVDREREEEENREDGHIPPPQLNDRDATSNLKELISSLTPKKKKIRKSLHVGAAKGLLGKRPPELDQDDDEEDNSPKRIRGREASPVKNVKLPAPPSKEETVVRKTRASTSKLFESPEKSGSFTPKEKHPSGEVTSPAKGEGDAQEPPASPRPDAESQETQEAEPEWEPIQLQDFLNMTNIHFMELTTTKRRHTTAPSSDQKASGNNGDRESKGAISLEDCVAAGFCTVPMLELYQHSCRELKSYISEGRQIIRSIEAETYADNPPLFREYVTARPDIRLLMDNQFRNVKTHARLLSKAMWYEWRMKLLEGLKEGLDRHVEEMKADDAILSKQEKILNSVVPGLVEKHSTLQSEATKLQQIVDEMENCDQDELRRARERLAKLDAEIAAKKKQLQEMQEDLQDKVDTIEAGAELKSEFMTQIREAERIKEECRGWSVKEVNTLKASVHALEAQSGWSIVSAAESSAGPLLTMRYRDELQVIFHPKDFRAPGSDTPSPEKMDSDMGTTSVELMYRPKKGVASAASLTPAKSLILSFLRSRIATIPRFSTSPKQLLRFISEAWNLALTLEEEMRMLEFNGVTKVTLMEKEGARPSLRARCILLGNMTPGEPLRNARVDVDFIVTPRIVGQKNKGNAGEAIGDKLELDVDVALSKVYGFGNHDGAGLSESRMRDIILQSPAMSSQGKKKIPSELTSGSGLGHGVWGQAVRDLAVKVFS